MHTFPMTYNTEKLIENNGKSLRFEDILNDKKIRQLELVLEKYHKIVTHYGEGEVDGKTLYPRDLIMKTFKFEKPVTSIEITDFNPRQVSPFIEELKKFFFVEYTFFEIFISHFRTLCDVAIGRRRHKKIKIRLSCNFPDFEGFYYGYPLKEVAKYCLVKGFYHLIR